MDRPASSHLVLCSMKPWYLLRPIHTSDRIDGTVDLSWFCSFAGHFSYSTKEQAPSGGEERWLHFFNYNLYSYRSEAIDSISCTFVMRSEQVSRIGFNMSQMLSMMKPLPHDAEYPKEFFVDDLEYLPRTIYHIIRRTLWLIKGHSSAAKLEGAMKTLVFYILNGISFNTQEFFIWQLAASGSDLFGLKFYAPCVMRLIKHTLLSTISPLLAII